MESLVSMLAPESRVLLAAAAVAAPARGGHAARREGSLSWDRVVERAIQQRCAPLLCRWLAEDGEAPAGAARALDRLYAQNLFRADGIYRQLAELAHTLTGAGIPAMALKGVYLARAAYADPALRPMVDIDLLVPQGALSRLPSVLSPLGYRPENGVRRSRWDELFREDEACKFVAEGRRAVEFHVALGSRTWPRPADVWEASRRWETDGLLLCAPHPTHLLIHLVKHVVQHLDAPRPVYLIWLADIARVLARFGSEIDAEAAGEAFRRLRIEPYAALMLRFCRDLLQTPVPGAECGVWSAAFGGAKSGCPESRSWCEGKPEGQAFGFTLERLARLTTAGPEEVARWQMEPTVAARSRWRRRPLAANLAYAAALCLPTLEYVRHRSPQTGTVAALVRHGCRLAQAILRHARFALGTCRPEVADGRTAPGNREWDVARGSGTSAGAAEARELDAAALLAWRGTASDPIRVRAVGTSMLPLIRPGDAVVVAPVTPEGVAVGDVVVWLDGQRLIAHRVIRLFGRDGRRMFQSQGDARPRPDPARPIEQLLGRVVAIERSLPGKEVIPVGHRRENCRAGV